MTYSNFEDELLVTILSLKGIENRGKLVGIEFDYRNVLDSFYDPVVAWLASFELRSFEASVARSNGWEGFSPTVNNSSDNLMYLSVLSIIAARKSCT